jgi:hypothetical protein
MMHAVSAEARKWMTPLLRDYCTVLTELPALVASDSCILVMHAMLSLSHTVSAEARKWMTPLLRDSRVLTELPALAATDAVPMASSALENTFVTQPQQQNMHGRVFGGFLMRSVALRTGSLVWFGPALPGTAPSQALHLSAASARCLLNPCGLFPLFSPVFALRQMAVPTVNQAQCPSLRF